MQLAFEHLQTVGAGAQPDAIHTSENIVQILFVGQNGSIYATEAATPMGEWADREFTPAYMVCDDVNVEFLKAKYLASSIFVCWKNAAAQGEVVPYAPGVVHTMRQRFAVWTQRQDLTKYLIDGRIDFNLDDPVATLSLTFENPNYLLSNEEDTNLTPGTSITLFFRSGDSARYIMGRYFIDKNDMDIGDPTTAVDGRNTIGKFLKDQTFDENTSYPKQNLKTFGEALFTMAGIKDFWVSDTTIERGMKFTPDMNILEGFEELIKTTLSWKIDEDLTGRVGFGDKTDAKFAQSATYTFYRNQDIFSRNVSRDDQDTYARVCVKAEGVGSATTGKVTSSTLNIRPDPSTKNDPIGTLNKDDVIDIVRDLGNGWLEMNYNAIHGYVWAAYVSQNKDAKGDFYAYADVDFRFVLGRKKTMHVTAAKDTTAADAQTFANDLAALLGKAGTIESFSGPFRPHLRCGDMATIIGQNGSKTIGMITSIGHSFGRNGYTTDFTTDSGMVANKTRVSDYINKITGQQTGGNATRLY